MTDRNSVSDDRQPRKFGTFGGVFTPSVLTILGVIMFLRFSTVVGYAGLWSALLILGAAKMISLITGLSIASIATNMRVRGGGAYYLISRSPGVEFGGVIAVFFFIAQAVAVTLYVVGFTEAIFSAFPGLDLPFRMVATISNLVVFICVYIGAGWTIRIQYGILAVLGLSVLSFFIGAGIGFSPDLLRANLGSAWTNGFSFFTVFALFFPAVTGIMAGVNMSGDLRDPGRSIPRGTFSAIGISTLIYASVIVFFAASMPRTELIGAGFAMKERAFIPFLVYAGAICATLSSAFGSMMGAPRILQAFARDNVFKPLRRFGRGSGRSGEPRNAIVLTFLIAQTGVLAGDLNTVAPIITMFFLLTYGTVNLACFYEGRSKNPSFRPTFRLNHWSVSFIGAAGCLGVMFLINAVWAGLALILSGALYYWISRAEIRVEWGDVDSGLAYQRARSALLRLEREQYHPKNWRPSILALSGGAYNRQHLAEYACWFTASSGIVSLGQVIPGKLEGLLDRRHEAENILRKFIYREGISAFPVVIVEENIHTAIKSLVQCHGISGMRPNTVLLGWSQDPERAETYYETINIIKNMKRSLIIVACVQEQEKTDIPQGAINIWWTSSENGALMLLLAHLLRKNPEWREHSLRIIRPVAPRADVENITKEMREMLTLARIDSELVIIPSGNPIKAVRRAMKPSAILFAGLEFDGKESAAEVMPKMQQIVDLPGDIMLIHNAGDVSLQA
ncbi:MAG TPA: amino acid permease [bacterium]|nr:amino acid permease [bacterium]